MRSHFIHVGKTGGTAVKHALQPVASRFNIVLHSHETTLPDIPEGERVFFFLRDPVTRFVSGFNSRKRRGMPRIFSPWNRAERKAFRRFPTAIELARSLYKRDRTISAAAEDAMRGVGHVNSRFLDWFVSPDYLLSRLSDVILIGFQETIQDDFNTLRAILRLPSDISLPCDPVLAHKTPPGFVTDLDDEATANLRRWYAEDIRFYEFCKELRFRAGISLGAQVRLAGNKAGV
jgi:hypothetical protein